MSKSSSPKSSANNYHARLCHVVKRKDFDGYGFNLHAEKGRPGQFIGKFPNIGIMLAKSY
jgi:hypothetical protein